MHLRNALIGLTAVCVLALAPLAWAGPDEASKAYEEGKALLAKGDFDKALDSFAAAAKADPENQLYSNESDMLGRIIKLRQEFKTEEDADVRAKMGQMLFNYYQHYKIRDEALAMAGVLHEKLASGDSAAMLADAQLALDKNEDAAKLLGELPADKSTARTEALHGVALARLGKAELAKAIADKWELPKEYDAQVCFDAARLYAAVGSKDKALKILQSGFEMTRAAVLDAVKAEVKDCKDLQTLASDEAFAKVMETKSKLKGCGGCATPCSKAKAEGDQKSKDAGCKDHEKGQEPKKDSGCGH